MLVFAAMNLLWTTAVVAQEDSLELQGSPPGAEAPKPTSEVAEEPVRAESDKAPQTQPPDLGFGQHELAGRFYFPSAESYMARVDRRDEIDATSDRTILWPTAHTPRRHRLSYSNHMLRLNRLAYSITDDLQLATTLSFANDVADFYAGGSLKITVSESDNHVISIQPLGYYREDVAELSNRDFGFGAAFLADLIISNDLIVTLGATGYGTVWYGEEEFTYENCQSRRDFLDGNCRETRTESTTFPSGGHWLAAQVGATWYMLDSFSMRAEVMSGLSAGSVLGTEWIRDDLSSEAKSARFTSGELGVGVPHGSEVTAGLGLAWSSGHFAAQLSGYVTRAPALFPDLDGNREDTWVFVPMLNVSAALF